MVNEVINPFLHDLICILLKKIFKIFQFSTFQWMQSFYLFYPDLYNLAIYNIKLSFTLKSIIFTMYMNWFMFIGIKKYQIPKYSKIFGIIYLLPKVT